MKIMIDEETVKLALEALHDLQAEDYEGFEPTLTALRQAIEQAQKQEPLDAKLDGVLRKAIVRSGKVVNPPQQKQEPVAKPMTASRAVYFMERFKHEEKLLGPNEQAALDFVIAMLEQAQKQEPVARVVLTETLGLPCLHWLDLDKQFEFKGGELLYTSPPQRQPLTDEQILAVARNHYNPYQRAEISFARAIEAAHGITGEQK